MLAFAAGSKSKTITIMGNRKGVTRILMTPFVLKPSTSLARKESCQICGTAKHVARAISGQTLLRRGSKRSCVPKHRFSTTVTFCVLIPPRFRSRQVIHHAAKRLNFSDQQPPTCLPGRRAHARSQTQKPNLGANTEQEPSDQGCQVIGDPTKSLLRTPKKTGLTRTESCQICGTVKGNQCVGVITSKPP